MLRSNTKPIKGFILEISDTCTPRPWQDDFDNCTQVNGAVLYNDKHYSRNVFIDVSKDGILIYKGDRHLYHSFRTTSNELIYQPSESLVGTSIIFDTHNRQLAIKTDILGSEPIYYLHQRETLWVTDRIDNFSRYLSCPLDLVGTYSLIAVGASIRDRTSLSGVKQSNELQTITYDNITDKLTTITGTDWHSNPEADIRRITNAINERLYEILRDAPDSALMLSAGWDSRVLMSDVSYIKQTYTHGDLSSREINIVSQIGKSTNSPMSFMPLSSTKFGAEANNEMLTHIGQCLFPHWYHASKHLSEQTQLPLTSGMFVELLSGHYGINIIRGSGRKRRTVKSFLLPEQFDKIADPDAINRLTPLLASGFKSLPWFFPKHVHFQDILDRFNSDVHDCLTHYNNTGTSGIQELCERFKMQHVERQYMASQTKTACFHSGYHHPFVDSKLSRLVLQLKYRHRVGYKLSKSMLKLHNPNLLDVPLAATLVNAKAPIFIQELSRFARKTGEQIYRKSTGKLARGLGWNNFQFLNKTDVFHEYIDNLKNDLWAKDSMHKFVKNYCDSNNDAYSLVVMLGRIATVDYQITASKY